MISARSNRLLAIMVGVLLGAPACLLLATPAKAQSAFSREGLGEWLEGYDMRGEALGSTGIGTIDPCNFSCVNPAATAFSRKALGYVGLHGSVNWTDDGNGAARVSSGMISGIGAYMPLSSRLGMRMSVRPCANGAYIIEERIETGGDSSESNIHREEGSRGMLRYAADLSVRGGANWAVAFSIGLQAGSILDESEQNFSESGWTSTTDRRLLRFRPSLIYGGGFQWSPWERMALGGAFSVGTSMKIEEEYRSAGGSEWTRETELDPSHGAGGGASIFLAKRVRLSGDVFWRSWDEVRLQDGALPQAGVHAFRNTLRWGIGLERTPRLGPRSKDWDRLAFRLGFAWLPWYIQTGDGDAIHEWRLTGGVGIGVREDRGRIDLLFAWGRRGSLDENGLEEEYIRFGFGCAFASTLREY